MQTFVPCDKCKNGYIYKRDTVLKCDCLKTFQSKINTSIALNRANIYDEVILSLDKIKGNAFSVDKVKYYCNNLTEKFRKNNHLYLVGPNGTQKTYTAKTIILEAIQKGLSCQFILMNDLITLLTDIYEKEYNESIEKYFNCDILVIDECFDPKKITIFKSGYQIPYLDSFLRKRIEQSGLNTIFTANIFINDIDEIKFSKDIKNLLQRSILHKEGELPFTTVYSNMEDSEILSMWN